ncbi:uncharacterized protein LOC144239181 [Crocuta crocuta]
METILHKAQPPLRTKRTSSISPGLRYSRPLTRGSAFRSFVTPVSLGPERVLPLPTLLHPKLTSVTSLQLLVLAFYHLMSPREGLITNQHCNKELSFGDQINTRVPKPTGPPAFTALCSEIHPQQHTFATTCHVCLQNCRVEQGDLQKIKVHIPFHSEASRRWLGPAATTKPVAGKVERGGVCFETPPVLSGPARFKPSSAVEVGGAAGKEMSGSQRSPFLTGPGAS